MVRRSMVGATSPLTAPGAGQLTMLRIILIGLGAGTASALLFASVARGSPLAFVLANFAQLPIMIAAVGWTHLAAIAAVLIAASGLAIAFGGTVAFAFLLGIGLPAWFIGYLALLARPAPGSQDIEWFPVGRIVVWTAIAAGCVVIATMLRHGFDLTQMQAGLRRELEIALRFISGTPSGSPLRLPSIRDPERLIDILVLIVPPLKATALTITTLLNLWLAAMVVRISGLLRRPWPQIAEMTFPKFAPTLLAIAVAGTFLPDLIGLISGVFTASLLFAYALLGLAVTHAITAGVTGRGFMLTGLYFTVCLFGWPILLLTFVGLLETIVALRARVAARRGPPSTPHI
jgi:hypothetical protein